MLHVALHPVFYLALAAAHRPPRKLLLLLLAVAVHATEPPSPSPSPPPRPAALPAWTCPGGACCELGAVLGQTIAPAFGGNDWTAQEKEAFCEGALDKLAPHPIVDTTFDVCHREASPHKPAAHCAILSPALDSPPRMLRATCCSGRRWHADHPQGHHHRLQQLPTQVLLEPRDRVLLHLGAQHRVPPFPRLRGQHR